MQDDHLEFGHLLDRVLRAFFPVATVLEATVRHEIRPPLRSPIDVNGTAFDFSGEAHRTIDILREDSCRKSKLGVVGRSNGLVDTPEATDRDRGSEELLSGGS